MLDWLTVFLKLHIKCRMPGGCIVCLSDETELQHAIQHIILTSWRIARIFRATAFYFFGEEPCLMCESLDSCLGVGQFDALFAWRYRQSQLSDTSGEGITTGQE